VIAAIVLNVNPILVQLGPLAIRWYGLMYVVGIIVGVQAGLPYVRARGITEDQVWNVLGPCIVAGLVGGRLFYVVQQPLEPFIAQPWRIIATWEGGMAFFGAIFAVILVLAYMCWREKIPYWTLLDGAAIFAAVGQAFGRIGNIINGDILGAPSSLAWGVIYANPNSFAPSHTIPYQPAAVYELCCDLILIGVLFALRNRLKIPGLLTAVYLIGYTVSQFLVFFLRDSEPVVGFGLKQAQLTSIVVFVAAVIFAIWRLRVGAREEVPADQEPEAPSTPSAAVGDTA
jgi:phosphatidylglycerol:prolipoprotein diacylglycerol transferase